MYETISALIFLVNWPSSSVTADFTVTIVDCATDTFEFAWPDGSIELGEIIAHQIVDDSGYSISFD